MRRSEAHLAGIVSLATDAIVSVDADHRIVLFNTGAERIFGYSADEIQGQQLNVLIPERYRSRHNEHLDTFARSPVSARRTLRIAHQSIWVGLGLSGVAMGFAAAGMIPPITGALLQEAIDVAVILNAQRSSRTPPSDHPAAVHPVQAIQAAR